MATDRGMALLLLAALAGCDAGTVPAREDASMADTLPDAGADASLQDATGPAEPEAPPPDLSHTFEALTIAPTSEEAALCQSWTIGNEEPLWVNRIVARNEGGYHHSNWIWVPDSMYPGDDGTWPCSERGFDQIVGGAAGGVFFAQSTQSLDDEQAFPEGAAFLLPARTRIIGDVHTLNPGQEEIVSAIHFDLYTLPEAEVTIPLQPMAFTNLALEIAPRGETHARMQCATPQPDFDVYYVLPHFHVLGTTLRLDVAGGPLDGMEIFRSTATYGDPLGETFDPPVAVTGASALGITCEYVNPRDETVGYGIGDQEMCVVLIYTDGKKGGGTTLGTNTTVDVGGVRYTDAPCLSISLP